MDDGKSELKRAFLNQENFHYSQSQRQLDLQCGSPARNRIDAYGTLDLVDTGLDHIHADSPA